MMSFIIFTLHQILLSGSSVGIVTGYGQDGSGIESRWGPPSLLYNGYWVFPRGKERPGRDADPSPPSSAMVMKEQSYTSTPPMDHTACTEPQCLYKGALYLFTYQILLSQYFDQAMCWTVRGSNPNGTKELPLLQNVLTSSGADLALYSMDTRASSLG